MTPGNTRMGTATLIHQNTRMQAGGGIPRHPGLVDAIPEHSPMLPKDAHEKSKIKFWTDYIYQSLSKISVGLRALPGTPEQLVSVEDP